MTRSIRQMAVAALFLIIVAGACKKKEQPAAPVLAPPEQAFPHAMQPGAEAPAEAEVKASSGPIELTFRLYKKKMVLSKDEDPWAQVILRNVSDKKISITDDVFNYPGFLFINHKPGVFIDLVGPDNERLKGCYRIGINEETEETEEPPPPGWTESPQDSKDPEGYKKRLAEATKKYHAQVWGQEAEMRKWRHSGLSIEEQGKKLMAYNKEHGIIVEVSARNSFRLAPGESTTTAPWADLGHKPVAPFAELSISHCLKSGKYRLRAVYDLQLDQWAKDHHISHAEFVLVNTPWVEFEVLP